MQDLVVNAIDFLTLSTEEFTARPKHSIIAFHSAVELFLKARLMQEHWSLIVSKTPDLVSFQTGDFVSVSFEEACHRLAKVVGNPLPEPTRQAFDVVRKHRNKLVHFFHDMDEPTVRERIAVEQLNAWHGLVGLLKRQWCDVFDRFELDLDAMDRQFAGHRLFLKTRFDSLASELEVLKRSGKVLTTCGRCGFEAAEIETVIGELEQAKCHVCQFAPRWLSLECTKCEAPFRVEGDETSTCLACGEEFEQGDIAEIVDDDPVTYDNYYEHSTPGNCSFCDGYHTVVSFHEQYLCTACLHLTEHLGTCGWCNEGNNGDMEDSTWRGCNFCDGRAGLDRD